MTKIKRTFLSILLASTLILGNISTAFAAVPMLHEIDSKGLISVIDNDTHFEVIQSSSLPEGDERRDYLLEWMEVMDGTRDPGEYLYLLSVYTVSPAVNSSFRLNFSRIPLDSYYYLLFVDGKSHLRFYPSASSPFTHPTDDKLNISYLYYTYSSSPINTQFNILFNTPAAVQSTYIVAASDPDYFVNRKHSQSIPFNLEQHGVDWVGKLIFTFDDDLYGVPEPTPNPKPDPDPVPPYIPPDLPDIPTGDGKYVVYDTSAWKGFLDYVIGNIGSAVKAGLLILGIISGVLLAIKVVKMFTRSA